MVFMRWQWYLEKGRDTLQKKNKNRRYIRAEFLKHCREHRITVHDRDLRMWEMAKATAMGLENFNASDRLIAYLEQK